MPNPYPRFAKIVVTFEPREDGGLRAYCDSVPGFVLSHRDPSLVVKDVAPVLERMLSEIWGREVHAEPLPELGELPEAQFGDDPERPVEGHRDYLAHVAA